MSNPEPASRDAFLNWMVGRNFRHDHLDETSHIRATGWKEEMEDLSDKTNYPDIVGTTNSRTYYLEYIELDTEEIAVEGELIDAKIDEVLPPDDSECQKIPFDSVRIEWMKGSLTEI